MFLDQRKQQVLTHRQTVVSPGICDAEGGGADRCMSRMRERGGLLLCQPLTVLRLCSRELTLQHGNSAAGRVDVGCDAQRAHAESAGLSGRAHRRCDRHHARGVHADWDQEVWMLGRSRSHRILNY